MLHSSLKLDCSGWRSGAAGTAVGAVTLVKVGVAGQSYRADRCVHRLALAAEVPVWKGNM